MDSKTPLLQDELPLPDKIVLANMTHHPGFKILVKLLDGACVRATEDVLKVNPENENYERLLLTRQQKARAIHDFVGLLRKTIQYHTELGARQQSEIDEAAITAEKQS